MGARIAWILLSLGVSIATNIPDSYEGSSQGQLAILPEEYPEVRRADFSSAFVDKVVPDPYRWLEATDSNETAAFVAAQDALTRKVLGAAPARDAFQTMMTRMYNFPKRTAPSKHGDASGVERYYYSYNTGLQAQSVLYTQDSVDSPAKVLLDPNLMSADGTVAVTGTSFSQDGRFMAFQVSSGGSDWETIQVLQIDASGRGTLLNDTLINVKFSTTSWTTDNKGFFYNRFDPPVGSRGERGQDTGVNENQQLWYHLVGTPQDADAYVLSIPEHPDWTIAAGATDEGRYLVLEITKGTLPFNQLWFMESAALPRNAATSALDFSPFDMRLPAAQRRALPITQLVSDFKASFGLVDNNGSVFTMMTDYNAPRSKLVRVDFANPAPVEMWEELIPEHPRDILQSTLVLKDGAMMVEYMRDVTGILQLRNAANGALVKELALPGKGTVSTLSGRKQDSEVFYDYTSMDDPGSVWRYDTATPDVAPVMWHNTTLPVDVDLSQVETRQVFVTSKDGTRVPMFILCKKDIVLDSTHPALLYAYGGFSITTQPTFSVSRLIWVLAFNGVAAISGIRGGGEYGATWWNDGRLHHKQNGFDDFAASAQWLHSNNYSSPTKTTIQGGSNGGMLMSVSANQHPELYGAVLSQVGVHDMLRFPLFTIGGAWETEYGDPTSATDFPYIRAYSPLHNVAIPPGSQQYPAMMLLTADHDDRVVPLHSYKMIATLQHTLAGSRAASQRNPLVLRVETRAGHGGGEPTDKIIAEYSDMYAFAAAATGAEWNMQL